MKLFGRILALFLIMPVVELALLVQVDKLIGFWPTIGVIVATGLIGSYLARREGRELWRRSIRSVGLGAAAAKPRLDVVIRNAINSGAVPGPRYLAASPEFTTIGGLGDTSPPHIEMNALTFGTIVTGAVITHLTTTPVLETLADLMGVSRFLWEDFLRLQHQNLYPVLVDVPVGSSPSGSSSCAP